ncbi:MAG TPA: guanylate kinase [Candidatus Amulumruptor caecigallinarius]|uniref:Guanylate kinase n=1 Tax=Candidatus Amulumruptor caecigallinarius TaxID=2109911 RepID=A0A921EAD9_9BACT|nr:guanylate kinase [Candidatus Amulumruptor caecigallinarius]
MANKGKIIIISAPSGTGKSTIINRIIADTSLGLQFSISATSREPRKGEAHGVNYYFFTEDDFRKAVADGRFVEWEEVYPGRFYGTLRSEIDRITSAGHNVIMDVDVKGGVNIKRIMGADALSVFVQPPSVETLRQRLVARATDTPEQIEQRVAKAEYEMAFAPQFDRTVVNDDLHTAVEDVRKLVKDFISE